jgi:hypothetical protein
MFTEIRTMTDFSNLQDLAQQVKQTCWETMDEQDKTPAKVLSDLLEMNPSKEAGLLLIEACLEQDLPVMAKAQQLLITQDSYQRLQEELIKLQESYANPENFQQRRAQACLELALKAKQAVEQTSSKQKITVARSSSIIDAKHMLEKVLANPTRSRPIVEKNMAAQTNSRPKISAPKNLEKVAAEKVVQQMQTTATQVDDLLRDHSKHQVYSKVIGETHNLLYALVAELAYLQEVDDFAYNSYLAILFNAKQGQAAWLVLLAHYKQLETEDSHRILHAVWPTMLKTERKDMLKSIIANYEQICEYSDSQKQVTLPVKNVVQAKESPVSERHSKRYTMSQDVIQKLMAEQENQVGSEQSQPGSKRVANPSDKPRESVRITLRQQMTDTDKKEIIPPAVRSYSMSSTLKPVDKIQAAMLQRNSMFIKSNESSTKTPGHKATQATNQTQASSINTAAMEKDTKVKKIGLMFENPQQLAQIRSNLKPQKQDSTQKNNQIVPGH